MEESASLAYESEDLNLLGLLFESLVVRDPRIYASANDATVSHYRDNTGLEVDAVVETGDGKWAAFEIKLGGDARIDGAAESLLRFRDRVDTSKIGDPSKLAVIVATGYAYERADGIAVAPSPTWARSRRISAGKRSRQGSCRIGRRRIESSMFTFGLSMLCGPVTGNQLARLAGRSYAQVSAVVRRLVREGMVLDEQHGRTYSYRLNREHVLALGLFDILSAPSRIEDQIWDSVEEWDPPPETVALFGPVARREAAPDDDVDVLVVRPDVVRHDDVAWRTQLGDLEQMVQERTGNRVHLVELDQSELAEAVETNQPLIESLRVDARTVFGTELRARLGRQS